MIEQHLSRLAAEITELQTQARDTNTQLSELRSELTSRIERTISDSARLEVKIDSIETRMQSIGERVGDSELRLSNIRKELNGLRYTRFSGGYPRQEDENTEEETTVIEGETESGEQAEALVPASETDAYQTAYADFLRGEFNLALTGFRDFVHNFPQTEKADDAQYYIGECLYNLGDYEAAVEEYDVLILRYEESQYKISATYKKALSFFESNQPAQGVILLQQLIRRYPEANEARLARQKLRSLGLNP